MPFETRTANGNRKNMKSMELLLYSEYSQLYSRMITGNAVFLRDDKISLTAACGNFALHSHDDRAFASLESWVKAVDKSLIRSTLVCEYYKLLVTNHRNCMKLYNEYNSSIQSDEHYNRSWSTETVKVDNEKNECMQERTRLLASMNAQLKVYKKEEEKRNIALLVRKDVKIEGEALEQIMFNQDLAHQRENEERLQSGIHSNYLSHYSAMLNGNKDFLRDDTVSLINACDNFASKPYDKSVFEFLKSRVESVDVSRDRLTLATMYCNLIAANHVRTLKLIEKSNLSVESYDKYQKQQLELRKNECKEERKSLICKLTLHLRSFEEENKKRNILREKQNHQASVRKMLLLGNVVHHEKNTHPEESP